MQTGEAIYYLCFWLFMAFLASMAVSMLMAIYMVARLLLQHFGLA